MRTIKTSITEDIKETVESIRPQLLSDYIGQAYIKQNINMAIKAAKIQNTALGHILFYGPPGLGKTSLAYIIANEMGAAIKKISAPNITKQGELAAILSSLNDNDVLFIDEIHRLPKFVEEILYAAMEDFKIDILVGEMSQAKVVTLDLPRFTLIGATTMAGMLSAPLRDRFQATYNLEYYNEEDLCKIIDRTAGIYNTKFSKEEARAIAKVSRQTPRIANNITKRVTDYLIAKGEEPSLKEVKNALAMIGYNDQGLSKTDVKYIDCLTKSSKPMGLKTIAAVLGETIDTIELEIEPYLLRNGYIQITSRGRILAKETA